MNKTEIDRLLHRWRAWLFRTLANALFDAYRPELHYMRGPRSKVARQASGRAVTTMVRESHLLGQCTLLGELIDETCTRYFYRRRFGDTSALVDKRSPTIHVVPCKTCPDYSSSSADWLKFKPAVRRWAEEW